jgi:hypothetical protein
MTDRSNRKGQPRADGPTDEATIEHLEGQRNNPRAQADYQTQPDGVESDRMASDRTGTARRAEGASGPVANENNLNDSERALRESRGDRQPRDGR